MQRAEISTYAPRANYTPPVPGWKTSDQFRDYLPSRDRFAPEPEDPKNGGGG